MILTLVLALSAPVSLDHAAVRHCSALAHPQVEQALAIGPDYQAVPVSSTQRTGQRPGRGGRAVVYNVLSVPADSVALCHSHPSDGGSIVPGPGDWGAVRVDRPSYIVHDGRMIKLFIDTGQQRWSIITGAVTTQERRAIHRSTTNLED